MKGSLVTIAAFIVMGIPYIALGQDGPNVRAPTDRPVFESQEQSTTHLVVLNRRGKNFELARENMDQMRAHRQIYLDLTASGHIIASGILSSDPPVGFVLFREGVDEAWVRKQLEDDFAIERGIVELEFLEWNIQMGGIEARN